MRKLSLIIIVVMLLASCVPVVDQPINKDVPISTNEITVKETRTPVSASPNSPSPSPLQTYAFVSSAEGESVSETFYTGDLEHFFMLSSEELRGLISSGYEDLGGTIVYRNLGASFEYWTYSDDGYILFDFEPYEEEPAMKLHSIVLSSFNFRGLDPSSNFEEVRNKLGDTEMLIFHKENGFDYVLRYIIGDLLFDFLSPDEKNAGGINLVVSSLSESQVVYRSCGIGQNVSKTLTTGDLKIFLKLSPDELDSSIGNGKSSWDEDAGVYRIYFEYLGVGFSYCLKEAEKGDNDIIAYPINPLECVWIKDFDYYGLNNRSSFEEIMEVLGKSTVLEIPILDTSYFALQYKIDGLLFQFSASDKEATEGISLRIMPC